MSEFLDITSNDNWFKKHPEKIAGVEFESTSFMFPIQVKGTKEDVLRVTSSPVTSKTTLLAKDEKIKRLRIAKAKANAILIQLALKK
jgi:hypothetical protein